MVVEAAEGLEIPHRLFAGALTACPALASERIQTAGRTPATMRD